MTQHVISKDVFSQDGFMLPEGAEFVCMINKQGRIEQAFYRNGIDISEETNEMFVMGIRLQNSMQSDFVNGLQYLIQQGILKVPVTHVNSTGTQQIPQWLRSNANLWSSGQISDIEFLQTIQYLISDGMIKQ